MKNRPIEETSSGWGCPHELGGACKLRKNGPCRPGVPGCILYRWMKKTDEQEPVDEESINDDIS